MPGKRVSTQALEPELFRQPLGAVDFPTFDVPRIRTTRTSRTPTTLLILLCLQSAETDNAAGQLQETVVEVGTAFEEDS